MSILRELIAKVVLRVDETSLKRLDTNLSAVKAHIAQTQAQAQQGVRVNVAVNAVDAQKSLAGIRVALSEMGTAVDPAALAKLQEKFGDASAVADRLRLDIDRLKAADPTNPRIAELQQQLNGVESEAKQTATALGKVKISLDGANKSAGGFSGMLGQLKSGLGALGLGLGVAGLAAFVHQTIEAAGAVEDVADRLGVTTDEAQVWSAFAKGAGAENEALSASFKGLANAMQGAANGGKEQKAAFETLGISTDKWKEGLPSLTEMLALVGGRLGELDNEGQRLALTQKLLSEGGLKLAPAFKGGTAAVQEHLNKLKELAVVYDEEFVKSAGEAGDELDMFYGQFRGLGSELILTFMPALRTTVQTLTPFIRGIREAFKNSSIFKGILAATGITALASFGGLSGVLARIWPMLKQLAVAAAPFLWAFAKFALLALIFDDVWVALNGGKSVIGHVLGKFAAGRAILETFQMGFKLLKGTILSLWGAISGDPEAIAKGAALLDQYAAWIKGVGENIKFAWNQLWNVDLPAAVTAGLTAVDSFLKEKLGGIYTFLVEWGGKVASFIGALWDGMVGGLKSALRVAGKLLSTIPGYEGMDPDSPDSSTGNTPTSTPLAGPLNALTTGTNPTLPASGTGPAVTVHNDYTFETNITGNTNKEVVAAVQRAERTQVTAIKDNRKTMRHALGATR
jgi:hypothetical protein